MRDIKKTILDVVKRSGDAGFSLADLAVFCWCKCPELFGLEEYGDTHPDPTTVRNALYGARGLIAAGKIEKLPDGRFRLAAEPPPEPEDTRRVKTWSEIMGE